MIRLVSKEEMPIEEIVGQQVTNSINIPEIVQIGYETMKKLSNETYNPNGADEQKAFGMSLFFKTENMNPELLYHNKKDFVPKYNLKNPTNNLSKLLTELLDGKREWNMDGGIGINHEGTIIEIGETVEGVKRREIELEQKLTPGNTRTSSAIYFSKKEGYAILLRSSTGTVHLLKDGMPIAEYRPENKNAGIYSSEIFFSYTKPEINKITA